MAGILATNVYVRSGGMKYFLPAGVDPGPVYGPLVQNPSAWVGGVPGYPPPADSSAAVIPVAISVGNTPPTPATNIAWIDTSGS